MAERLHLGVTPHRFEAIDTAEALAGQAETVEALGYDSFWLPESHFTGSGALPAPLLLLSTLAARTRRMRLGTTSFLLPVRHPLHVAEEVAVLDRLSGGRVILGLGRGFRSATFAAFGVPAAEKRDRFEAALGAIRDAWQGKPVGWEEGGTGRTPVHLSPLPVQKPHPPLWVAAFGPKAVAQAGRLALPYLASPVEPLARLEDNHARHRDALPPESPALPVPVMRTVFVNRDPERLRRVREAIAAQAAALAKAPIASLRRLAEAGVDDVAIVGEPAQVADAIARYRERIGMTHLIVRGPVPGADPEDVVESLRLLTTLI